MNATRVAVPALLMAALLSGCDDVPESAIESCSEKVRVLPARTDILVVVDDSGSMQQEQENLRRNLSDFVHALSASAIPLDFQIGVTTTDVDNANLKPATYPATSAPYNQYAWPVPFPRGTLVAVDPAARTTATQVGKILYDPAAGGFGGPRILTAGSASLVSDFEANVLVGTLGSGKEEPLRAAQLALTDRIADGTNAGFLRSGARLGIIILTDEDDCSESTLPLIANGNTACHDPLVKARLQSLSEYVGFLEGPIDGEVRDPVVAVIAGFDPQTLEPAWCGNSFDLPTRLDGLLDSLGPERTLRGSICDASFGPSLLAIADQLVPQTVELEDAPADGHMLLVTVRKTDGSTVACPLVTQGEDQSQAGVVFSPPRADQRPQLTFRGACRLVPGDQVDLQIVCAR